MKQASGMTGGPYCYIYDANGLRVEKGNGGTCPNPTTVDTLYWRSVGGDVLAETDKSGNTVNEYVFFAGRRVAQRTASGSVYYYYSDRLGTTHTVTDATGHPCYDASFTPYGQEVDNPNVSQTCSPNYRFTGDELDSETGLYYARARHYSWRLARFMSTDPLAGNTSNPQSLNGYAYVWNNTENQIDPTGLWPHGCLARVRRQDIGGCDYGSIDENAAGGDFSGDSFDQEVLLGNGGPGFGDLYGYTIFDAVAGAPGTYFNLEPTGQVSWGFSVTAWYSAMAAQDAQLLANSREGYFRQLGAAVAALQAALQAAGVQPGRIQDLISAFIQENSSFNPGTVQLGGGNFDFQAQSLGAFLNCANERCDEGSLGTIDYSHNDGTLHLDTADPFNFPGGTFLHTAVDVFLGNLFYFVIPR